jgi:hypothetical protein
LKLNIIAGNITDRHTRLKQELAAQGIADYELWDGVYLPTSPKEGINAAHRQIVEFAQLSQWPMVAIAEDDIKFTHPNSWNYFISQIPKDFDIYLSMIFLGEPDENHVVKAFTGMTLYIVHERFYDTFLSVNPKEHIDHALAGLGRYIVCHPFVATQHNGLSGNTGRIEQYEDLTRNRQFYFG